MAVQSLAAEQPARPSIPEVLSACASVGKVDDYVGSVLASHGLDEQFRSFPRWEVTEHLAVLVRYDPVVEGIVRDHVNCDARRAHCQLAGI